MRLRYRVWQLWQNVRAEPLPDDRVAEVTAVLSAAEAALFFQFSTADQWHSVRVLQTLRAAGYAEPALCKAALLHDVGKTRLPLSLWDRVWIVLAGRWLAGRVPPLDDGVEVARWQRPFVVKAYHAAWGADMAAQAGSDGQTVALIRHHQDSAPFKAAPFKATSVGVGEAEESWLAALQWADDQN
jgi:hypothetical protein